MHDTTKASPHQTVVELRRYRLHPGRREELVDLFDRHLVESQEDCGMSVLGQFRDLDRPDDFVWLRGFAGMEARRQALAAFYDGPVWAAHKDAANATMDRFDDVLLLKPIDGGFALDGCARPAQGAREDSAALFMVLPFPLAHGRADSFPDYFARRLNPLLSEAGAPEGTCFVTESSANTYPRLPVRENERVFVWFARFGDRAAHRAFSLGLEGSRAWRAAAADAFDGHAAAAPAAFRLTPTSRSLLR